MAKVCPVCGESKTTGAFSRDDTQPDGKRVVCRSCGKRAKRVEYPELPEDDVPISKTCGACGLEKSHTEFHRTGRCPGGSGALAPYCRPCTYAKHKAWRERNKLKQYNANKVNYYKTMYGLSLSELAELRERSAGMCSICGLTDKLVVDHDHATGKVRGLLCHNCNLGLGNFRDNVDILREAIEYLCRSRSK